MRKSLYTLGALAALVASVSAQQTFFATSNETLVRTDLTTSAVFTLGDQIHSLEFGPDGTMWATSRRDNDGDGAWTLYQIADPFGTPSLVLIADNLPGPTPSIAFVGSTLYGLRVMSDGTEQLMTLDEVTGAGTIVGATGNIGIDSGGLEYDASSGLMYALDHDSPSLHTLDYSLSMGVDPSATLVGSFGLSGMIRSSGLGHDDGTGQLFTLITMRGELAPRLYEVDKSDGSLTLVMDLSDPSLLGIGAGGTGLAVVPEPSSLGLLVLGSVMAVFRRRR